MQSNTPTQPCALDLAAGARCPPRDEPPTGGDWLLAELQQRAGGKTYPAARKGANPPAGREIIRDQRCRRAAVERLLLEAQMALHAHVLRETGDIAVPTHREWAQRQEEAALYQRVEAFMTQSCRPPPCTGSSASDASAVSDAFPAGDAGASQQQPGGEVNPYWYGSVMHQAWDFGVIGAGARPAGTSGCPTTGALAKASAAPGAISGVAAAVATVACLLVAGGAARL
jgi:hypothetical protein